MHFIDDLYFNKDFVTNVFVNALAGFGCRQFSYVLHDKHLLLCVLIQSLVKGSTYPNWNCSQVVTVVFLCRNSEMPDFLWIWVVWEVWSKESLQMRAL